MSIIHARVAEEILLTKVKGSLIVLFKVLYFLFTMIRFLSICISSLSLSLLDLYGVFFEIDVRIIKEMRIHESAAFWGARISKQFLPRVNLYFCLAK